MNNLLMDNNSVPLYKDKVLWITLAFYLIAFTDFISDYIPVSVAKVALYFMAVVLIILYTRKCNKRYGRLQLVKYVVIPYLFMLFLRLTFDFVIEGKGFSIYSNSYTIIFFFVNAILIPILFYSKYKIELNVVAFCVISAILMSICFLISIEKIIVESVASVTTGGQYDAGGHLDIISYGQYSSAVSLIGFFLLFFYSKNKKLLIIALFFIITGIAGIVLSAARSAVVSLIVGIVLLYIYKYRNIKKILFGIILLFCLSSFFSNEIISFNDYLIDNGFNGFNRIVETFFNKETRILDQTNERDYLFNLGVKLFLENPIFGSSYLTPAGGYVHNIFIEQFMALGLIGGSLFVFMNIALLKYSWIVSKVYPSYSIIPVLFIQNLIYGCFSMTIIGLTAYWLFASLIINKYTSYINEKRIGYNTNL